MFINHLQQVELNSVHLNAKTIKVIVIFASHFSDGTDKTEFGSFERFGSCGPPST